MSPLDKETIRRKLAIIIENLQALQPILTPNLAEKIAPSAGLRNRLVHQYDRLGHSIVLQAARMAEDLFPIYVEQVEEFLAK